jgi:hypothetical protein
VRFKAPTATRPSDSGLARLGGESLGILIEQRLGIDSVAGKRAAAEMVDEQVTSDRKLKPCAAGPFGEILVVKEPESKPFVEPTDLHINGSLHEQAKSRQLAHAEPAPAMLIAPCAGKAMHFIQIVVRHVLDPLRRRRIIGHRPNQTNAKLSPPCEWGARGGGQRAISHSETQGRGVVNERSATVRPKGGGVVSERSATVRPKGWGVVSERSATMVSK